ncbi:MAG: F-box-like [Chlamydiales bacterium]|jgi:hypothetical protein|nr:F-box-like [Chlamydiales bacterium]
MLFGLPTKLFALIWWKKPQLNQEKTINDLPLGLLLKIFSYLDIKENLACMQVCKKWQALNKEIWEDEEYGEIIKRLYSQFKRLIEPQYSVSNQFKGKFILGEREGVNFKLHLANQEVFPTEGYIYHNTVTVDDLCQLNNSGQYSEQSSQSKLESIPASYRLFQTFKDFTIEQPKTCSKKMIACCFVLEIGLDSPLFTRDIVNSPFAQTLIPYLAHSQIGHANRIKTKSLQIVWFKGLSKVQVLAIKQFMKIFSS